MLINQMLSYSLTFPIKVDVQNDSHVLQLARHHKGSCSLPGEAVKCKHDYYTMKQTHQLLNLCSLPHCSMLIRLRSLWARACTRTHLWSWLIGCSSCEQGHPTHLTCSNCPPYYNLPSPYSQLIILCNPFNYPATSFCLSFADTYTHEMFSACTVAPYVIRS